MKTKLFILCVALATSVETIFAEKVQIGDLYYNLNTSTKTAEVTNQTGGYDNYPTLMSAYIPSTIVYNGINYNVISIGKQAFFGAAELSSVIISEGVQSIGQNAFYNCPKLNLLSLPNSLTSIGSGAFSSCSSLVSITLPNGLTTIENELFSRCSHLISINIPESVTSIGSSAFLFCFDLPSITIPNSVVSIGEKAFMTCSSLNSITIGNGMSSIGSDAFINCSTLNSLYISDLGKWCNVTFANSNANPLYYAHNLYVNNSLATNIVIPNGVVTINDYVFYGCNCSSTLSLPNSVTTIGKQAFCNCSGLISVNIGNNVTTISSGAFYGCTSLASIVIPNNVILLGDNAFEDCIVMDNVTLGNGLLNIGGCAFRSCNNISSITIPDNVKSIGNNAFENCRNLSSIYIGSGLTAINEGLCKYCEKLHSVTIGDNVLSIGNNAFDSCDSLKSVILPDNVISIGDYAFYECKKLSSITFGNKLNAIGKSAFSACPCLRSVFLPNSLSNIGYQSFGSCMNLEYITLGIGLTVVHYAAFANCPELKAIYAPCGYEAKYKSLMTDYANIIQTRSTIFSLNLLADSIMGRVNKDVEPDECTYVITITAIPNNGFHFTQWNDGYKDNPRTISLTQDTAFTAEFEANSEIAINDACGEIIKAVHSDATSANIIGTIGGIADKNTSGEGKLGKTGHYFGIKLEEGNFLQGDTLIVSANQTSNIVQVFSDKGETMLNEGTFNSNKQYSYVLTTETEWLYLYRTAAAGSAMNPFVEYMTVHRPCGVSSKSYHVIFCNWDGTILSSMDINEGEAAIAPENPMREGCTFIGWDKDFSHVMNDMVITAMFDEWQIVQYDLIFTNSQDNNEIMRDSISFKLPMAPVITGFTFIGWRPVSSIIVDEIEIQAIYQANEPTASQEVHVHGNKALKLIRDGNVYVLHNNVTYTISGQRLQ